ncbi:hypothetical protein KI809_02180 [Geobacter pelophilus]|uniref:Porin n=1 Tax=Geoanaerobacter pelophilus TaxID=60036 RepID=A0AAW4L4C7_9BACT|nr:hypothetical protein [Geoanaerobacter pelophilus]MBT0663096.1 hypothetical protein [Geoanaerobacter pelophilus]
MKKKVLGLIALGFTMGIPAAMAQEVPQATAPSYNCDFEPACEVAPGIYGKMASPVTSKFNLSIGGFVKLDYAYNSVNLGPSGALAPGSGAIPKSSSAAGQQDQSILTARQSRFWLKVAGPPLLGAKTTALIEADFYGDPSAAAESPQLRMRQAWGSMDWANTQVLFGQAYDIFGPMIASTIDFRSGSPFGTPNNPRVPQVRLTQKVNLNADNSLKLVLGVQDPNQNGNNNNAAGTTVGNMVNTAGQVMFTSKALGVAPGYFGMSMNSLTAGLFGLYGNEKVAAGGRTVDSYGYGFYTFVPVLKSKDGKNRAMTLSLEGQAYMAANMAFNAATAATTVGAAGNESAAKGYGLAGQAIFYPTQNLGITAGYGKRNAYNYASYSNNPNFQKSSSELYVNVAYDLNAAIRVAAEYQNLNTQYGNNSAGTSGTGSANVARFAAFYFF